MAVKYLLPCSCGEKIVIDVGKAGRMIRCRCGHSVEVPTLREIKKLHQFQQQARDLVGEWNPRRAVALAGATIAAIAVVGMAWLWLDRPISPQPEIDRRVGQQLEQLEDRSFAKMRRIDRKISNMTVAEINEDWHRQSQLKVSGLERDQKIKQAGGLTVRQVILERARQDPRLVEYRQQERLNTNFSYIALTVALAAAAICGTALFVGRRTVVSGQSKR